MHPGSSEKIIIYKVGILNSPNIVTPIQLIHECQKFDDAPELNLTFWRIWIFHSCRVGDIRLKQNTVQRTKTEAWFCHLNGGTDQASTMYFFKTLLSCFCTSHPRLRLCAPYPTWLIVDTPLFGCKYLCMYQFLRRNSQKLYFHDNI